MLAFHPVKIDHNLKAVTDRVSQEPLWLLGQLKKNNFQHAQLRREIYGIKSVVEKPVGASF